MTYYYIFNNKGLLSSGNFSEDKLKWVAFTSEEKRRFEVSNRQPYGSIEKGLFISAKKFEPN
jgi:hypothetical protein